MHQAKLFPVQDNTAVQSVALQSSCLDVFFARRHVGRLWQHSHAPQVYASTVAEHSSVRALLSPMVFKLDAGTCHEFIHVTPSNSSNSAQPSKMAAQRPGCQAAAH